MAVSRVILTEVGTAIRALLASIPPFGAPVQQRADYHIRKAEVYELLAITNPAIAAHALQQAAEARREAHAITLDY